jgi:hypothetical protein
MLTERWLEILMEFTFTTEYIPGDQNFITDALSYCYEGVQLQDEQSAIYTVENNKEGGNNIVIRTYSVEQKEKFQEILQKAI